MKTFTSMLVALMLLLGLATPGLADGGDGGDNGGDTVTKTFNLDLAGDISEDQVFSAFVATREAIESEEGVITLILFCGAVPDEEIDEVEQDPTVELIVVSNEACEETEYEADVQLERGAEIAFVVLRTSLEDEEDFEIIAETPVDEDGNPAEFETIDEDTTNFVSCNFENGSCNSGEDQRMPSMVPDDMMGGTDGGEAPEMPDTGAGAAAGGSLPAGNVAAALSALAACAYAVRRR